MYEGYRDTDIPSLGDGSDVFSMVHHLLSGLYVERYSLQEEAPSKSLSHEDLARQLSLNPEHSAKSKKPSAKVVKSGVVPSLFDLGSLECLWSGHQNKTGGV